MAPILRNKFIIFALMTLVGLVLITAFLIFFSEKSENKPFIYQIY